MDREKDMGFQQAGFEESEFRNWFEHRNGSNWKGEHMVLIPPAGLGKCGAR